MKPQRRLSNDDLRSNFYKALDSYRVIDRVLLTSASTAHQRDGFSNEIRSYLGNPSTSDRLDFPLDGPNSKCFFNRGTTEIGPALSAN